MKISRETRIGIFVVSVLIASFCVLNYLRGEDIFGKEMDIRSHYSNVEGLVASDPVYISGYKIGTVSDVKYNQSTGVFDVTCSIQKKIPVPADTKMTIYSVDLMGGKGIRLDLGTSDVMVEDGDELEPSYAPDMVSSLTNLIGPLIVKASSALDSLSAASAALDRVLTGIDENTLRSAMNHIDKTLDNTEQLTGVLSGHSEDIESLVMNLKNISDKLAVISEKADSAMTGIGSAASQLGNADIEGLINSFRTLAGNLNDPDGTIGKLTNDGRVYESLDSVLKDIDSLVKKIEENPKKYVRIRLL